MQSSFHCNSSCSAPPTCAVVLPGCRLPRAFRCRMACTKASKSQARAETPGEGEPCHSNRFRRRQLILHRATTAPGELGAGAAPHASQRNRPGEPNAQPSVSNSLRLCTCSAQRGNTSTWKHGFSQRSAAEYMYPCRKPSKNEMFETDAMVNIYPLEFPKLFISLTNKRKHDIG